MFYCKVQWIHAFPDEPVWIYGELGDDRNELRRIELFADGTRKLGNGTAQLNEAGLSLEPWPSLEEIGSDPEFLPFEISRQEFEDCWTGERHEQHPP